MIGIQQLVFILQRSTELKQEWELPWNPYNNVLQMQRQMT